MKMKHARLALVLVLVLCGNLLLCLTSSRLCAWVLQRVSLFKIFHSIFVSVVDIFQSSGLQSELLKV
jgi:ABC-type anion transport system duplicated permease subunit